MSWDCKPFAAFSSCMVVFFLSRRVYNYIHSFVVCTVNTFVLFILLCVQWFNLLVCIQYIHIHSLVTHPKHQADTPNIDLFFVNNPTFRECVLGGVAQWFGRQLFGRQCLVNSCETWKFHWMLVSESLLEWTGDQLKVIKMERTRPEVFKTSKIIENGPMVKDIGEMLWLIKNHRSRARDRKITGFHHRDWWFSSKC